MQTRYEKGGKPMSEIVHTRFLNRSPHNITRITDGRVEKITFRNAVQLPSTTYATFGLYKYPAKFIPQVVAYILDNYAEKDVRVFDPFAGYGTVGVVSRVYGKDYELWDLNPMLGVLHSIATMKPTSFDRMILDEMKSCKEEFIPEWSHLSYWFPKEFLPFLYKVWGYYHSLDDKKLKLLLTIPLLKTTRYFSYDDTQRQKLTMSSKSQAKIHLLLNRDWKSIFFQMIEKDAHRVLNGLYQYQELSPKRTKSTIRAGIDSMNEKLRENADFLITSPPYLQSQEYIRQAKLDLFWLGYSEERMRELSKLEIPYRNIEPFPIYSKTFEKYQSKFTEPHIRKVYDRYFWGILGTLTRLQENINSRMFLFVGHSSVRGGAIPIDEIFVEHLSKFGWKHEVTLMDTIVSRRLFAYKTNPASGIKDARTSIENLVVLKRT